MLALEERVSECSSCDGIQTLRLRCAIYAFATVLSFVCMKSNVRDGNIERFHAICHQKGVTGRFVFARGGILYFFGFIDVVTVHAN